MEKKSDKSAKTEKAASKMDGVLFGIIQSLLSNSMVYPANSESAIIDIALKMKREMLERDLL